MYYYAPGIAGLNYPRAIAGTASILRATKWPRFHVHHRTCPRESISRLLDWPQGTLWQRLAKEFPSDDWTSTQLRSYTKPKFWVQEEDVGSKAAAVDAPLRPSGCGSSPFEDVLRQLPSGTRIRLVDSLTDGGNASSGKQATLAAARLSCKALCRAIDDGLQSLRLDVLPDTDQGPAPSLSHFPNVTSLTLSIFAKWRGPKADGGSTGTAELLPGEQPKPRVAFWFREYAFPPSLLLEPLQGQPLASLQRLQNITLVGLPSPPCASSCVQLSGQLRVGPPHTHTPPTAIPPLEMAPRTATQMTSASPSIQVAAIPVPVTAAQPAADPIPAAGPQTAAARIAVAPR